MPRMTRKTMFGDYGIVDEFERLNEYELIQKLANRLGKYEDAEEQKQNGN